MAKANGKGTFRIESDIPVPTSAARSGGLFDTLSALEVGQSFLVARRRSGEVANFVQYAKKKTGRRFTCRTTEGDTRIWRTK